MITIADILDVRHVDLNLKQTSQQEAIFSVASMLKDDDRVLEWNQFYGGLKSSHAAVAAEHDFELCIPHTRTNSVSGMVMSAGRTAQGVTFQNSEATIHYIFVIGVPSALAADYLRIIGALARIFKDTGAEKKLRVAKEPTDFLALLSSMEMKL